MRQTSSSRPIKQLDTPHITSKPKLSYPPNLQWAGGRVRFYWIAT